MVAVLRRVSDSPTHSYQHITLRRPTGRLVLYLVYFPRQLRYCQPQPLTEATADGSSSDETRPLLALSTGQLPTKAKTAEWKLALSLAGVVAAHL